LSLKKLKMKTKTKIKSKRDMLASAS